MSSAESSSARPAIIRTGHSSCIVRSCHGSRPSRPTRWGWRHFVFATAARAGYKIRHVVGDYPCPPDQREENDAERLHRLRQLQQNIQGLLLGMDEATVSQ